MPKDTSRSTKRKVTSEQPMRDQSGRNAADAITAPLIAADIALAADIAAEEAARIAADAALAADLATETAARISGDNALDARLDIVEPIVTATAALAHARQHTVTDVADHTFPGGTTFLRADGTWAAPTAGPGGSNTQVQFNDAGALGGDAGLVYDKATDMLSVAGPIALGATPASAGSALRMSNASQMRARNAANSGDIEALTVWSDDMVYVGGFVNDAGLVLRSTTDISVNRGITFPAVQVAGAGANNLDDYEEGTWSPNLGGSTTYNYQLGFYTKVGRLVTVIAYLDINLLGTGDPYTMSGLPFAVTGAATPGFVGLYANLAVALNSVFGHMGGSAVLFCGTNAAAASTPYPWPLFGNGSFITYSAQYIA